LGPDISITGVSETLKISGGTGITTTAGANTITIDTDSTIATAAELTAVSGTLQTQIDTPEVNDLSAAVT
jgi:hypothetical protein